MFTTITTPFAVLYEEATKESRMISQILFGEQIHIIEKNESWFYVKNLSDECTGWVQASSLNKKQITLEKRDNSSFKPVTTPWMTCFKTTGVEKITIPGGSLIPLIEHDQFDLMGEKYQIAQYLSGNGRQATGQLVVDYAMLYINAPYLPGGKTIFGIDDAGLVQVSSSMAGWQLPRLAKEQVEVGEVVDFLAEVEAGDLAFFGDEEGNIVHVGILINSHQIVHVSGSVKKEIIDSQGIISSETGEYTHYLRVIKRIFK